MTCTSFDPIFVLDSRETLRPSPVEESIGIVNAGLVLSDPLKLDWPTPIKQPVLPNVAYYRVHLGQTLNWHQWWLWWLDNPGPDIQLGVGRHEGDWEFVQIAATKDHQPILVSASQHKWGGKREYWACERDGRRPVFYVGLGSHAMFFQPGSSGVDECNGRGLRIEQSEFRMFGDWAHYEGRWGNSASSPQSPGKQGDRWHRPHLYHSGHCQAQ